MGGPNYEYDMPVYGTIVAVAYHAGTETIYKVQLASQQIVEVSDKKLIEMGNKVTGKWYMTTYWLVIAMMTTNNILAEGYT